MINLIFIDFSADFRAIGTLRPINILTDTLHADLFYILSAASSGSCPTLSRSFAGSFCNSFVV